MTSEPPRENTEDPEASAGPPGSPPGIPVDAEPDREVDRSPDDVAAAAGAPPRPGLSTFTIEGRAAPALFVVGWLASILGLGILAVGFAGSRGLASTVLILVGLVILSIGLTAAAGSQAIERRAAAAPYSGPSPILLFAASVTVSSVGASLVALGARAVGIDPQGLVPSIAVLIVIQLTYLALTRLLVVGPGAMSWTEIGFRPMGRPAFGELASGMTYAIPVVAVTGVIASVAMLILRVTPESPLPATGTNSGLLLNLLAGAVFVPIGEETMFRGVATSAWQRTYGTRRAIIQGGLFFAFVHVLQVGGNTVAEASALAVVAFVTRIPVGLALGWLFLSHRSIWTSIGLHSAFNAILLVLGEISLRAGSPGS